MSASRLLPVATAAVLGWGALAFGANYPWAYGPLLVAAAALGVAGILAAPHHELPIATAVGFVAVGIGVLLQLVPLPHRVLAAVSPEADRLLRDLDVAYALSDAPRHALTIAPRRTLVALALFASFSFLMLGTARWVSRYGTSRLVSALAVLGTMLAVIGIVQRPLYNGRIYGLWAPLMGGAPFGPFVNKNHFAGWMLMAVPVVAAHACGAIEGHPRSAAPGVRRLLLQLGRPEAARFVRLSIAALLMAVSLVLTMSRSGIAALGVVLAAVGLSFVIARGSRPRRIAAAGFLLVVTAAGVASAGAGTLLERFEGVGRGIGPRLAIWGDTLRIISDFWLVGTGLNSYGVAMLRYQTVLPAAHLREAHNEYLQLAAEGGLLLGVPVLVVVMASGVEIARRFRQPPDPDRSTRVGALIGLVAVAVQSAVDFSLQMPGNAALFAVICGLALHGGSRTVTAESATPSRGPSPAPCRRRRLPR